MSRATARHPYPIEKGIPMAQPRSKRVKKYPIPDMKIGDSFLVPKQELHRNLAQSVRNVASSHKMKVATRTVEGGVRVWRVK